MQSQSSVVGSCKLFEFDSVCLRLCLGDAIVIIVEKERLIVDVVFWLGSIDVIVVVDVDFRYEFQIVH